MGSSHSLETKSTPNHIHHHYVPSATPTHTKHTISSTSPTYAPHCHPWIYGQTPLEKCWLVDQKRDDRTTPHKQGSMEWVDTTTIRNISNDSTASKPSCLVTANQVSHKLLVNGRGEMPTKCLTNCKSCRTQH